MPIFRRTIPIVLQFFSYRRDESIISSGFDGSHNTKLNDLETWYVTLDRVTGQLEVESSWGKANWVLTCKKVNKLVDK